MLSACLSQNALKSKAWCLKTNLAGLRLIIAEFLKFWYVSYVGFASSGNKTKPPQYILTDVDTWLFSLFNAVQHHCATLSATQCQLTWHCKDTVLLCYCTIMTMYSEAVNSVAITTIVRREMPSCPQTLYHYLTIEGWVIAKMLTFIVMVVVSLQFNYFEYYQWNLSASILFCGIFQHHKWMNGCSIFLHVTST